MNELQIIFQTRVTSVPSVPDNRYRILVSLIRSDKPNNWNFRCVSCSSKIVEVLNQEVADMHDFFDPQNMDNAAIGRHCKGTLDSGLPCKYSYFFHVR